MLMRMLLGHCGSKCVLWNAILSWLCEHLYGVTITKIKWPGRPTAEYTKPTNMGYCCARSYTHKAGSESKKTVELIPVKAALKVEFCWHILQQSF